MTLITRIILVVLVSLPLTGWCANLKYDLEVNINTDDQKVTGNARISSDTDIGIRLAVLDLKKLKIDGDDVNTTNDKIVNLTIQKGQEVVISYEARFNDKQTNVIDQEHVFLIENWYPRPDVLAEYTLSATLPKSFIAVSESETAAVQTRGKVKTFHFQFNHPVDAIHLAASTKYVLKKDVCGDIVIEAYLFKEDAHLSDIYLSYTKKYLQMYDTLLTPYPFRRFAVVEHILPTGISMPTFTLLGQQVIRLPFIVKTSLGHEILHQWFGNSVYIDDAHGNWAEGITTYLSDHHYAAMKGEGAAYRKQIMINYNAYVNEENTMSVSNFSMGRDKAQRAVGYGKTAMLLHGLRELYGDEVFFSSLRKFILQNTFRRASWHDMQRAFEKVTEKNLYEYFGHWLGRKDIPHIFVETPTLQVEQGQIKLNMLLKQKDNAYPLRIPITLYGSGSRQQHVVEAKETENNINLALDHLPSKVVIDENYTFMRQLTLEEIPPVLSSVMGKNHLTAVVPSGQQSKYQPLIDALVVKNVTMVLPDDVTFSMLEDRSFLIAGYGNPLVKRLFGKQVLPEDGVRLKVFKNPYNAEERMAVLHVKNKAEARAVQEKITHYGKYTEMVFNQGRNTYKSTVETANGIPVMSRPATRVLKPNTIPDLNRIISELMTSRIIYIGEIHDKFAHHINQLLIIKKIHESGNNMAVGMEMFQRPYQDAVNDYIAGHIDESAFLRKTEYYTRWKYDYNLYKPIIDYIKQQKIPLLALNITGDITRKIAREGIHSLSDEEKKQIPDSMDFSDEQYRTDLSEFYDIHNDQEALQSFNYFLQAQTVWDEGMAETAHQYLSKHPNHKLIILAGNGHLRYKYGIPERLYRRNHEAFKVIVQDEELENNIADYVLLTTELKGKESPKLGVIVNENDQGLVIRGVDGNSPAKKAGLQKGDIIEKFGAQPITSLADLKLALFYSEYGSTREVQIKRDGKSLTKDVELFQILTFSHSDIKEKHKNHQDQ